MYWQYSSKNTLRLGRFFCTVLTGLLAVMLLSGCSSDHRKRPFGFVTLGAIEDLKRPTSFFSDKALLLKYDQRGFSAMSLLCTYDLAPLEIKQVGNDSILVSKFTSSSYSMDGKVLSGPATVNLPYFELVAAQSAPGKPADTLFAKIGEEKDPSWRFVAQ